MFLNQISENQERVYFQQGYNNLTEVMRAELPCIPICVMRISSRDSTSKHSCRKTIGEHHQRTHGHKWQSGFKDCEHGAE